MPRIEEDQRSPLHVDAHLPVQAAATRLVDQGRCRTTEAASSAARLP